MMECRVILAESWKLLKQDGKGVTFCLGQLLCEAIAASPTRREHPFSRAPEVPCENFIRALVTWSWNYIHTGSANYTLFLLRAPDSALFRPKLRASVWQ